MVRESVKSVREISRRIWWKHEQATLFTCRCIDSSLSSVTPRSRTVFTGWMVSSSTCRARFSVYIFRRLVRDPNHISSVFDGFSRRRLDRHQLRISSMHAWRRSMVNSNLLIPVDRISCVSSAYIWRQQPPQLLCSRSLSCSSWCFSHVK